MRFVQVNPMLCMLYQLAVNIIAMALLYHNPYLIYRIMATYANTLLCEEMRTISLYLLAAYAVLIGKRTRL